MEKEIERILGKFRPYIQSHGGDVRLIGINGKTVTLAIHGQCVGCALAELTYGTIVKGLIKEKLPAVENVVFKNGEPVNCKTHRGRLSSPRRRGS